jgi:GNAT superfamily N-acetyltransferase
MTTPLPNLPLGYSALAPGQVATIVTYLEMSERPPQRSGGASGTDLELRAFRHADLDAYRALFRRVGEHWLWTSRLVMPDAALHAVVADPQVEIAVLHRGGKAIGLLELDFRQAAECELAFFGLVRDAVGQGIGRFLMNAALARAWAKPIRRFWVHTCTFDHPAALDFYQRSGFRPYALAVEVMEDPRLTGEVDRTAAPHVPLIVP